MLDYRKGWSARVGERVERLGYPSLVSFLRERPAVPYAVLGVEIDTEATPAPVQLIAIAYSEIPRWASLSWVLRDHLARDLSHFFPNGWSSDDRFLAVRAVSGWYASVGATGGVGGLDSELSEVSAWFRNTPPHDGWKPTGPDDSVTLAAFASIDARVAGAGRPRPRR